MQIKNTTYGGERPLFASHGLRMEHVTIQAGESALKECSDIEAVDCRFEGKYPFWHVDGSSSGIASSPRAHARRCGIRATLR